MLLDGIFASEACDTSGERIIIKGLDITELEEGRGIANYEHKGEDKGNGEEIVGRIVYAKKIFGEDDCETERQLDCWKKTKLPLLYGVVRLYDGAGHEGAKALAAAIRDHVANDEKILLRYSIEGSTLNKEGNELRECVARRVALTWKPCNRSCDTGLLEDPNAPEGFEKQHVTRDPLSFLDSKKSEFEDPLYARLGGSVTTEGNPILDGTDLAKAYTAGSTASAPGSLVGTAALQREDSGLKKKKAAALAAIRDYSGLFDRDKFKTFAKMRMPEASDEFLDHFANLAEDYHVKRKQLAKKESPTVAPKAKVKKPAAKTPAKAASKPAKAAPPKEKQTVIAGTEPSEKATIRGVPIEPNPTVKNPVFDEDKGILHTSFGSFPLHRPEAEHFNKILSDPKVEQVHNQAMAGWVKVHKLLKEGRLPPEVVMHAALFANLSPNTPVPMQELMYGHLVDSMRHTGADAREPGFSDKTKADWVSRDGGKSYPENTREFFTNHPGIHLKNASKLTGRSAGEVGGFMLANNKMTNMDHYHENHHHLMELVNRNRENVRASANELMQHKYKAALWDNRRQTAISKDKPDIGPYAGPAVPGLAPKTTRYMMGMIGGGNVFVPDTHMVRHLAGLEQGKDPQTNDDVKNLMWDERNSHILDGIDRWYAKNHPAVQHMLQHPTWGKHFEKPEDAIFPAFWKHWIGIAPDERSRGMRNTNATEGTTHEPFWNAIDPFVEGEINKAEVDETLPQRTARIHAQYIRDYGEVPASMLYHAYLLPHLLDAAEQRAKRGSTLTFMAKSDALDISLRKAIAEFESHPTLLEPEMPSVHKVHMKIKGQHHPAGRYMIIGNNLRHLEDYHGLMDKFLPEGPVTEQTISRIHGLKMSPHLSIEEDPIPTQPEPDTNNAHPIVLPSAPPAPRKPSVFHYTRVGHDRPHTLEVQNGAYTLDGKRMSYPEVQTVVANVRSGAGKIRYKTSEVANQIKKMEDLFETYLGKAEEEENAMDFATMLAHMRAAEAAGHLPKGTSAAATRHGYEDSMIPGMGNKAAWNDFHAQKKPGVYVGLDGTDFSAINNSHGHAVGDQAIKAFGGAVKAAAEEAAPGAYKSFRPGGDEINVHLPSHEHAARFARALHQRLEAMPAIGGVHKLAMGMGFGTTPEEADKALYKAKDQKYLPGQDRIPQRERKRAFPIGQAPNMAHSLVPGHEGAIPLPSANSAAVHQLKTPEPNGAMPEAPKLPHLPAAAA